MAFLILLIGFALLSAAISHEDTCYNKFEYEFNVLQKLVDHEQQIASLLKRLEGTITSDTLGTKHLVASSYIRWGHSACAGNATLVYEGYAAGSHYTHTGAAVNYLCLPTDPDWSKYVDGFQDVARIYGSEYETALYNNDWKNVQNYDVPCALCRTTRANVIMLPGKNVCHKDYVLEYSGYLMAGRYLHAAASEYVCVDNNFQTIPNTAEDKNGVLFYHVEAECGSLKCPPYVNGRELTCAVCSYGPQK